MTITHLEVALAKVGVGMASCCRYSCKTATQTLEWINAINDFLRPYRPLLNAHVVNFFKNRLWESIDKEWMECLREDSVENLLKIPSGIVQDYWPASLKEFIHTLRSLVLPQGKEELQKILPDLHVPSLSSVLIQGMNLKKKHEVEILAALVNSIARTVGAQTIIDVGAGQGYLSQVLSFQYQLSVVAIDASSHHVKVTNARAERIQKHYVAQIRKLQTGNRYLNVPQTVTCRVLSSDTLKALSGIISHKDNVELSNGIEIGLDIPSVEGLGSDVSKQPSFRDNPAIECSLVLAGLHACGDLSVTMLRAFLECKEVKAVVSIGCCYNLLSEEGFDNTSPQCGFPTSDGVNLIGLSLGKNARDLACQSAERWRDLTRDAALQNFELHTFRAAFQMVLYRCYPEVLAANPSIGRQGKSLRRKQLRKVQIQQHLENSSLAIPQKYCTMEKEVGTVQELINDMVLRDCRECSTIGTETPSLELSSNYNVRHGGTEYPDKYSLFEKYCESGLCRLGLTPSPEIDFLGLWMEAKPFTELVGPYWSLRAALGPLVETLLLLDRLLFLQERGSSVEAVMVPLFNPSISPRNVAIIARKV